MAADPRIIRPLQVEVDLAEAADYLERQQPGLGLRFLQAAENTLQRLASTPGLGSPMDSLNPGMASVLVWPIRGFENWLIFFRLRRDVISVSRVLHGARNIERILNP